MSDLFLDGYGITKEAQKEVSQEPSNWSSNIISYAIELSPYLADYNLNIKFKKVKPKEGYAVGSMYIKNEKIDLPFVIKGFKLQPIDVFIKDKKWFPLTEDTLQANVDNSKNISRGITKEHIRTQTNNLYRKTNIPNTYNAEGFGFDKRGGVPFIDLVKSTITEKESKLTKEAFIDNDAILMKHYQNKGKAKIANEFMNLKGIKHDGLSKFASQLEGDFDTLYVEKIGFDQFEVVASKSSCYLPKCYKVDGEFLKTAMEKLGEFDTVDYNDGRTFIMKRKSDHIAKTAEDFHAAFEPQTLEASGEYIVKTASSYESVKYFPHVLNITDGTMKDSYGMCISENGYSIGEDFIGKTAGKKLNVDLNADFDNSSMAHFVKISDDIITEPFIVKMAQTFPDRVEFNVDLPLSGLNVNITTANVRGFEKIAEGSYAIPSSSEIIGCNYKRIKPINDANNFIKNAGADHLQYSPVKLINSGKFFSINGFIRESIEKSASQAEALDFHSLDNMDEAKTAFVLCNFGTTPENANDIIKVAKKVGEATVYNLLNKYDVDSFNEKTASIYKNISSAVDEIRVNLFKEASEIENNNDVMNVLSLNYIKPESLEIFFNNLDGFQKTIHNLAELLIYSRMSDKELDSESIKKALFSLQEVVNKLKTIKTVYGNKEIS